MNYFDHNDRKTRKPPKRTEHGTEIVEIDGMLVTETPPEAYSGNDRHGWHCPCVGCRSDRGEE